MSDAGGKPLFRYAVVSDTHIRPSGESSSPWKTNLLTNDRARWVIHAINAECPDFVIHLGDIVHPVPHHPTHGSAARVASEIMGGLDCPFYLVPGNHDVGDKDNPSMPAHIVNDDFIGFFREHYGASYRSFDHKGVHFVILNSPALNSGLEEEAEQRAWLEADLAQHRGSRVHVFSHYPPYLLCPDEASNYDNLDMPARGWLLGLLEAYDVEAFYGGHIHQFFHKLHHGTHIYNLLATGNLRQDYANLFRVEAAEEYGRNDTPKLGYAVVDVYPDGVVTHIRRSYGKTLGEGETLPRMERVDEYYPSDASAPLGVQVRYPLAEVTELPNMGPLDEFARKRARNDYGLLGLWETGIRRIRLPLGDLVDDVSRERVGELHSMGFRFGFFCLGVPDVDLSGYRDLVDFLEVILPWKEVQGSLPLVSGLRESLGVPVFVANIESSADKEQKGPKFSHYLSHGFRYSERARIEPVLAGKGSVDGFVFEVGQFDDPLDSIKGFSEHAEAHGYDALVNVRLAPEDPAEFPCDDLWTANRVLLAGVAGYVYPVRVFLDTFMDHDRGYFPRIGLYDRLLNPRRSAVVLRNLNAAFSRYGVPVSEPVVESVDGWIRVGFHSVDTDYVLMLPDSVDSCVGSWGGDVVDLVTGVINPEVVCDGSQYLVINRFMGA